MTLPAAPRYGAASVAELLPAALTAVRGGDQDLLPLPTDVRAVVLVVIDGLGHRQLEEHAALAPTLAGAPGVVVDAPFPSTTAVSLTTIGTGLPPGEHGLTGYSVAVPGHDEALITLTWRWGHQLDGPDARGDVPPERFQTSATVFERAAEAPASRAVTVLRPEFVRSGLTRAALRGGEVVIATDLAATLATAVRAVVAPGPAVAYAHHADLDTTGHLTGPGSDAWCSELTRIDAEVAAARDRLPRGIALLVTADHGMVHVPGDALVELTERPDLTAGVRLLTGDGRARQLHVVPGARSDVLDAWRHDVGDRGHVVTREQAIDAGWFGPTVTAAARDTIGDVVAVADAPIGWVHRDADLFGGRFLGLHAGLTRAELEVPALVLTNR